MSSTGQTRVHIEPARERAVSRIVRSPSTKRKAWVIDRDLQVFGLIAVVIFHADIAEVEECRAQSLDIGVIGNQASRHDGLGTDQPGVANCVGLGQIAAPPIERRQQIVRS